jgi:hypothetical protein
MRSQSLIRQGQSVWWGPVAVRLARHLTLPGVHTWFMCRFVQTYIDSPDMKHERIFSVKSGDCKHFLKKRLSAILLLAASSIRVASASLLGWSCGM